MAINVSSLSAYVDAQRLPLIKKAVLGSKSASLFNLQTGVKNKAKINLLTTAVTFGDGSTCGWNQAGTSTLTQREIAAGNIKINMSFCEKDLLKTWAGYEVKVAAGTATLPFEEDFTEGVIKDSGAKVEKAIWQGDTESLDANLNKFDGLLKILAAEASVVEPVLSTAPATKAEAIQAVYAVIPVEVLETASIGIGQDMFREYVLELAAKNLYNYKPEVDGIMEIVMPGTTTKIYGLAGLNGTKTIVAGDFAGNFFYGTDMEGDEEKFDLWYSKDNQEFRLAINFVSGVQVAFPDQVVMYEMA
jgi:hypothetical protein